MILNIFIPSSAEQIAKEIRVQQEKEQFDRTHIWIPCPVMSKVSKNDFELLKSAVVQWVGASTTFG